MPIVQVLVPFDVRVAPDADRFHASSRSAPGLHVDGATEREAIAEFVAAAPAYIRSLMQDVARYPPAALREADAARYVGLTCSFLRAARVGRCDGPAYIRVGRAVLYLASDLDAWLRAHRVGA